VANGRVEQREELEDQWGLKANHISSEYPAAYGGIFYFAYLMSWVWMGI
jgi:hypothetical protein